MTVITPEVLAQMQAEAKRQSAKWWAQQSGKSQQEILDTLSQPGGARPNPAMMHPANEGLASPAFRRGPVLTPEDAEGLMGLGKPKLLTSPDAYAQTQLAALQRSSASNLDSVNSAFSGLNPQGVPVFDSPAYKLFPPSPHTAYRNQLPYNHPDEAAYPAAYLNPNRTDALAEQMGRLEAQYPGVTHRMEGLEVGRADPGVQAWHVELSRPAGDPFGAVPYRMGTPAMPGVVSRPSRMETWTPAGSHPLADASDPSWFAANDALYPNGNYEATAAHETGHAVQSAMHDFVRGLDAKVRAGTATPEELVAATDYRILVGRLGTSSAAHISGYAQYGRAQAMGKPGGGTLDGVMGGQSSKEPFAELFSVARSPQGQQLYDTGRLTPGWARDLAGAHPNSGASWRTTDQQIKLMDNIGDLNNVEKGLRNVGFNEVGSAAPVMGLQLAAPVLAGLLASKTHGNVQAALTGAAGGAALGSWGGPEGTLVGGALGAGVGLAKQLL